MTADGAVLGAVLAGGASSRMGRTKATVEVDGRPLASRAVDALRAAGVDSVVMIGGDPTELDVLGVPVVPDLWPNEGPVGGVLTALAFARETGDLDRVVVLSCDLDRITGASVGALLSESDGLVSVAATERLEPLCAVWAVGAEPFVAELFAAGERALHRIIGHLPHVTVTVDDAEMHNVNRPEDLPQPFGDG